MSTLELLAHLIKLRLLFRSQDRKHLLAKFEFLAHEFSLQTSGLGQVLSRKCFIERTALVRLTQLLALGPKLFTLRFGALAETLSDLFHASFLGIGQIQFVEHPAAKAAAMIAFSAFASATPAPFATSLVLVILSRPRRLGEGN